MNMKVNRIHFVGEFGEFYKLEKDNKKQKSLLKIVGYYLSRYPMLLETC